MEKCIVIGAGQAGVALCAKLRDLGYQGTLTLIGNEASPPYQRPPLSKKYLLGEIKKESLELKPANFYTDKKIDLRLGVEVTRVEREKKKVHFANGETLSYDRLALTTGTRARALPASLLGNVTKAYYVRTLSDVDKMAREFRPARRALIIGGGYIGLEAAAVAVKTGVSCTLIEAAPRILERVACPETSAYFRTLHQAHGVIIRENTQLARMEEEDGIIRAHLKDGTSVTVDFALVGIGVLPNQELAEAANLSVDNGIVVDSRGATSDPDIFASGDCASFPWRGHHIRLESVQNAISQSETVAAAMLHKPAHYDETPWFWSDQYDVKLQIAGLNTGYDNTIMRPGNRAQTQSIWYYRGNELIAVDAMNDARAYMTGKRLLEAGKSPAPAMIADLSVDLKTLL